GRSASFSFTAAGPGVYRIASLVPEQERAGMWDVLEIKHARLPTVVLLRHGPDPPPDARSQLRLSTTERKAKVGGSQRRPERAVTSTPRPGSCRKSVAWALPSLAPWFGASSEENRLFSSPSWARLGVRSGLRFSPCTRESAVGVPRRA